jgi:protein O-mannosyl-transferase
MNLHHKMKKKWIATWVVLFLSVFSVYSNTFHASWHMDDTPNIVNNRPLHIDDLMPKTLWRTFFAKPGHFGTYYRPIACLTFALNWFLGQDNTTGYHLVNIGLHGLTALLIYLVVVRLCQTPVLIQQSKRLSPHRIALLCALFWALHPLQTQAVTYIVQRMAQLAALFYMAAILFYLKGRLVRSSKDRWFYFGGCVFFGLIGLMSKENAAMLPLALMLVEICFLQQDRFKIKARWLILIGFTVVLLTYVVGVRLFLNGDFLFFLKGYSTRPYTPWQRLLTESRILWFYLSQIVLPLPSRLSIEHDIMVSTSLISPWTTLPAFFGIILTIVISLLKIKKYPLLSFSILFFFLNHVVESSIIGLELLFEHRNYLPDIFLFLPMAVGILQLCFELKKKSQTHLILAQAMVAFLVISLGSATYIRNKAWQTGETLWLDALTKAPNSARALNTLAIRLAWAPNATTKQRNMAIDLFQRSLVANKARTLMDADIYGNIANVYGLNEDYQQAKKNYQKAIAADPGNLKIRADMIMPYVRQGQFHEALIISSYLVEKAPSNPRYLNTTGFLLLWLDYPDKALTYLRPALRNAPFDPKILLNIGAAMKMLGHYDQADWFFKRAIQQAPSDVWSYLFLAENQFKAGHPKSAMNYLKRIVRKFSIEVVKTALQEPMGVHPPLARQWVESILVEIIETDNDRPAQL